eukprot:745853-Hanusia_phi.AAC.7
MAARNGRGDDEEERKRLVALFHQQDEDGSGEIDAQELHRIFQSMGQEAPVDECKEIMRRYGSSGHGMDLDHFLALFEGLQTGRVEAFSPFLTKYMLSLASEDDLLEMIRSSSPHATHLVLNHSNLGQDFRLFAALSSNTHLVELSLRGNRLDPKAATVLSESLLRNTTLTMLDISANAMGDEGVERIFHALCVPEDAREAWLQLCDAKDEYRDCIKDVEWVKKESEAVLQQAKEAGIIFPRNQRSDCKSEKLREALERMRIKREKAIHDAIESEKNMRLAQDWYDSIHCNMFLQELKVDYNWLSPRAGATIAKALDPQRGQNTALTILSLARNALGSEGVQAIAAGLEKGGFLRSLNLAGNSCGPVGATAIASCIRSKNHQLTELDLSANGIGDPGAEVIASALQDDVKLVQLDVANNLIQNKAGRLMDVCDVCTSLRSVDLNNNIISMKDIRVCRKKYEKAGSKGEGWIFQAGTDGFRATKKEKMKTANVLSEEQRNKIDASFEAFDADGSGEIDEEEFVQAAERLGLEMESDKLKQMFMSMDVDGSGAIDKDEYITAMTNLFISLQSQTQEKTLGQVVYWKSMDGREIADLTTEELKKDEHRLLSALMLGSGVYDPLHLFPSVMGQAAAFDVGYRCVKAVKENVSLSAAHQRIIARVMEDKFRYSRRRIIEQMPFRSVMCPPHGPLTRESAEQGSWRSSWRSVLRFWSGRESSTS